MSLHLLQVFGLLELDLVSNCIIFLRQLYFAEDVLAGSISHLLNLAEPPLSLFYDEHPRLLILFKFMQLLGTADGRVCRALVRGQ